MRLAFRAGQQAQELEVSAGQTLCGLNDLATAIRRSQDYLLGEQRPEGYWVGELIVDCTLVADRLAYHHWNGTVDREWERKAINQLFSLQLPDGGWNIYYGGPAEVNATIKAYLALKLAGVPETDPRMLRARSVALNLGGVPRMNTFSKLYLALFGLFPWKYVPTIPCEVLLIGKWFHVNFWEMSNWSRAMLVPLAIINHFKPTRPFAQGISLDELYPEGYHDRDLRLQRDPQILTTRNFFIWLDRLHKFAELFAQAGIHPFRRQALKRAEEWMLDRFEGSDGLAAIFPAMLNSLIALKALGYPDDHPQVVRAEQHLKGLEHETSDTVRIEPCFSPVWDTAIALIALAESGVPPEDPRLRRATEWLLSKEIRFRGDWQHKNPANVEPSGWVFEFENKWNPDVDDTAMVLLALRLVPTSDSRRDEAYERGLNWMLTFQCKDGGWAAFDKDCTKNVLTKVPFADHNAMLDPECADITARILEVLGHERFPLNHPQVVKAIEYLRSQQEPDGSWYGRWGVNYLYGTWQVLRGLHTLGIDMRQPWLLKARDWLESVQHNDGGWGERVDTYEDPVFKGRGPSTASQTAWVVMALCAFGDPDRPSLVRGVEYLVRAQNPDGSWSEDEITGTGFPRVFYLKYDMYRNSWPLLALSTYRSLSNGLAPERKH
ncbi:MAG TPA: squalene--hopene cyclase [Candidatus Paceibacterota bacterium]|nr:squalene--hopene cyclase [Candidatus Paceibacterota bacterium]HRZ56858.1 squalene--hopene cyclase [Candidatus Paceibacterota bacterium]